jgi:type IV pilus assembly protein PilV
MKNQQGMTFIEVMVAMLIMVSGILGSVAMVAIAKKVSFDAMQRSLASTLAQDMLYRMRNNDSANLQWYAGNDYGETLNALPATSCDTQANLCTPLEMATYDLYEWESTLMGANATLGDKNVGGLINTRACVSVVDNAVTVVITWEGREEIANGSTEGCGTTGNKRRQTLVEGFVFQN